MVISSWKSWSGGHESSLSNVYVSPADLCLSNVHLEAVLVIINNYDTKLLMALLLLC